MSSDSVPVAFVQGPKPGVRLVGRTPPSPADPSRSCLGRRPGALGPPRARWIRTDRLGPQDRTAHDRVRRGEVKRGNKLPSLLPVAVYNGWRRSQEATDVAELIAPMTEPLAQYLPTFRYLRLYPQRIPG